MEIFGYILSFDLKRIKRWAENENTNKKVVNGNKDSPLLYAIKIYNDKAAELLVEKRLGIFSVDSCGFSPLSCAIARGMEHLVLMLVEKGVNVNIPFANGFYPLHSASLHGESSIALILIENGAVVNSLDPDGDTPLHNAAMCCKCFKTTKVLLYEGASFMTNGDMRKVYLKMLIPSPSIRLLVLYHLKLQNFILSRRKSKSSLFMVLKFIKTFTLSFKK